MSIVNYVKGKKMNQLYTYNTANKRSVGSGKLAVFKKFLHIVT